MSPQGRRAVALVFAALVVGVWLQGWNGRMNDWHTRVDACERGKLNANASAVAWYGAYTYLGRVLEAKSVKSDVKLAATIYRSAAGAAVHRLVGASHRDCAVDYPKPGALG